MHVSETLANITHLAGVLHAVTGQARVASPRPESVSIDALAALAEQLMSTRGEASGTALSTAFLEGYARLGDEARRALLGLLAARLGPDLVSLQAAARAFLASPGDPAAAALLEAAEPRRQELLRRLNHAPGGTFALVRMREDLMGAGDAALAAFEADFVHLFASWFNRGFLQLRRIDWRTPANILEKIIRYEAVHAIASWDDLRRRLEPADRRLYAFFHPALGDEPLIFVEVALTTDVPAAIAPLLAEGRVHLAAETATTAVFYSISNAQRGLAGAAFGNFLIKQVVEDLRRELPRLATFVTLSPLPGFAAWLRRQEAESGTSVVPPAMRRRLALLENPGWPRKAAAREALNDVLVPLAAYYLQHARNAAGSAADPVARFHLGNGARLERVNALGDLSPTGMRQSHGLMVNYRYELDQVARNHEAFVSRGEVVASAAVRKAARAIVPPSVKRNRKP